MLLKRTGEGDCSGTFSVIRSLPKLKQEKKAGEWGGKAGRSALELVSVCGRQGPRSLPSCDETQWCAVRFPPVQPRRAIAPSSH